MRNRHLQSTLKIRPRISFKDGLFALEKSKEAAEAGHCFIAQVVLHSFRVLLAGFIHANELQEFTDGVVAFKEVGPLCPAERGKDKVTVTPVL